MNRVRDFAGVSFHAGEGEMYSKSLAKSEEQTSAEELAPLHGLSLELTAGGRASPPRNRRGKSETLSRSLVPDGIWIYIRTHSLPSVLPVLPT